MKPSLGDGVAIDVLKLIESRLLIQANSGAGKSYALRRLLEQTYDFAPQIDVEGEFHTLREKHEYVLAGQRGGDCPADVKSAAMLARRVLELNVSVIIDIYELGAQRARFVRLFLEALVNAPRELWHPTIVVVDEAHMFCPEAGQSESASPVIDLMTRGRKRGFCGVLATQRIAKLHKDAAAECNNKLIGRSSLDIGDELRASLLAGSQLSTMEKRLLAAISEVYPRPIAKGAARGDYANSGSVSDAFSKLVRLGYITKAGGGQVRACDHLFGAG
jgi:DNA helicase HerA-like ATPase